MSLSKSVLLDATTRGDFLLKIRGGPWIWSKDQVHGVVHGPWSMFCIRPAPILPVYTIDEFLKSHFRIIRGTFEALCREVQATGRVPQQHAFGRPPIFLDKQVLAFVWFTANSEVIRSLAERVAAIFPLRKIRA